MTLPSWSGPVQSGRISLPGLFWRRAERLAQLVRVRPRPRRSERECHSSSCPPLPCQVKGKAPAATREEPLAVRILTGGTAPGCILAPTPRTVKQLPALTQKRRRPPRRCCRPTIRHCRLPGRPSCTHRHRRAQPGPSSFVKLPLTQHQTVARSWVYRSAQAYT
jgi:hypothetical protein